LLDNTAGTVLGHFVIQRVFFSLCDDALIASRHC